MARIDNAYAYYISTYAKKTVSRYDSHKKSELRKVYNEIVKINKDSPLYKIPNLTDAKKYAIDIKENARSIQNVVASLSDQYGSFEDSFKKKVAMSSDDEKVSVTYIGDGSEESKTNNFDIEVQRLATPQINQGRFLKDNTLSMRPGAYSFDLNTPGAAYEFQYNINSDETNLDVLDKLARLVNSSSLGITAEILSDGNGSSARGWFDTYAGRVVAQRGQCRVFEARVVEEHAHRRHPQHDGAVRVPALGPHPFDPPAQARPVEMPETDVAALRAFRGFEPSDVGFQADAVRLDGLRRAAPHLGQPVVQPVARDSPEVRFTGAGGRFPCLAHGSSVSGTTRSASATRSAYPSMKSGLACT